MTRPPEPEPKHITELRARVAELGGDTCANCNCTREEHGAPGLLNGCPTFLERPTALDAESARQLILGLLDADDFE